MLCDDVKRVVYFFLDGSLNESRQQELRIHLTLCPDCDHRTTISGRLRGFVRRRLSAVPAPDHLKKRLQRSLRAFAAEWNS
ncbi:MAG TPA: zf-HC2 domain-containing protein [Thermoanaerobaculia bacterium]|jgi:mycothiol system anti-sigma-R factor